VTLAEALKRGGGRRGRREHPGTPLGPRRGTSARDSGGCAAGARQGGGPTHLCRRQGCPILRPGETVTGATTGSWPRCCSG